MKWHYKCSVCGEWRNIDWEKRNESFNCHKTKKTYIPPGPAQQKYAFVDTHNWPDEMERVVVAEKGDKCTVPGCSKSYETLDHRVPFSKSGRTSVNNLYPMCNAHNQSKGDFDYTVWLLTSKND